jgi:aldose 1-epimerase
MTDIEHTLASEHLTVGVLPEVGARLHRLEAFGSNVLRTQPDVRRHQDDPFFWGGYHMAPWCNRLDAAGPVRVGTRTVDLEPNFPDGSAIHGQVFATPWTWTGDEDFAVHGGGRGGWPWTYTLTLHLAVSAATLRLDYDLTNTSDEPMPAGVGLHPWFRRPALVRIPAAYGFPVNTRTPAHPEQMTGALDLRTAGRLPEGTDSCWTDLTSRTVALHWPAEDLSLSMDVYTDDPVDPVIVAAHPAELGIVAVEPQTHAPPGLRRLLHGELHGLRVLDPGDTLSLAVTLTFHRPGQAS